MSEVQVDSMRISLTGPASLERSVIERTSPSYDGQQALFKVTITNASGDFRRLPFDELARHVVRVYRHPATKAEWIDNRTPPPKMNGAVIALAPGASRGFPLLFEFPSRLLEQDAKTQQVQFCARWDSTWLREAAYAPQAFDWNQGFEVCTDLRLVDPGT